jgi:AraC-like DNA-binding protein
VVKYNSKGDDNLKFENLRIKDVRVAFSYSARTKRWKAKDRKDHIIGFMLEGASYHDFGYQNFVLSRNDVCFFNRRDNYSVEVLEKEQCLAIHFTTYEELETDSFYFHVETSDKILALMRKAENLKKVGESEELALLSTVYELCKEVFKLYKKNYTPKDQRILKGKEYMDLNFCEKDCLCSAVGESGLSQRRFSTLFKGLFGATPNQYIMARRLAYAKKLLGTERCSVLETSERCGFSDIYYFSKVFKKAYGIAPSKWK